jgi:pyruvate dehydrogenase E2 component (dihydrolipoamide acetyltransferase)
MAKYEFKFPDVGEGIQEGTIVAWKVKVGDKVESDQVLGEVETDKAVVEIPSPKNGKILKLHVKQGEVIKVGETLVTFEVSGKDAAPTKPATTAADDAGGVVGQLPSASEVSGPSGAVLATPAVRKLASDRGVDLTTVTGTGAFGRITEEDVNKAKPGVKQNTQTQQAAKSTKEEITASNESLSKAKKVRKYDMFGYVDHKPLTGMRKAIATHMETSWTAPTVSHMDEADVTELFELREQEKLKAKKNDIHLTFLPYIIKATIAALQKHPMLNSSLDKENEDIIIKKYYNLGIAVDTGDGLIVPVLKGSDKKDLFTLAKEIAELAKRAQSRKIDLAELKGGTFTITNIGVLGGLFFTPLMNAPEAAILGTGKIHDKPLAINGKVAVRKVLPLVISFDHRVTDGAEAARFMNDLIAALQDPKKLK